jgi:hypothetical protein
MHLWLYRSERPITSQSSVGQKAGERFTRSRTLWILIHESHRIEMLNSLRFFNITNYTKHRPYWYNDACSAGQDILCLLWNMKVHYHAHKDPVLNQLHKNYEYWILLLKYCLIFGIYLQLTNSYDKLMLKSGKTLSVGQRHDKAWSESYITNIIYSQLSDATCIQMFCTNMNKGQALKTSWSYKHLRISMSSNSYKELDSDPWQLLVINRENPVL